MKVKKRTQCKVNIQTSCINITRLYITKKNILYTERGGKKKKEQPLVACGSFCSLQRSRTVREGDERLLLVRRRERSNLRERDEQKNETDFVDGFYRFQFFKKVVATGYKFVRFRSRKCDAFAGGIKSIYYNERKQNYGIKSFSPLLGVNALSLDGFHSSFLEKRVSKTLRFSPMFGPFRVTSSLPYKLAVHLYEMIVLPKNEMCFKKQ